MVEQSAHLSNYAYNLDDNIRNIRYKQPVNANVSQISFRNLEGFDLNRHNDYAHVFGLTGIMTYAGKNIGIVAFRGTTNQKDVIDDVSIGITNDRYTGFDQRSKVHVHELKNRIEKMKRSGISEILFTGHSLGGADATIAPVVLGEYYPSLARSMKFHVITFGSPRPGNQNFSNKFKRTVIFHRRITNSGDPVTNLPAMAHGAGIYNFIHVDDGTLIWNVVDWWSHTYDFGLTYCKINNWSQTCGLNAAWYTANVARSVNVARRMGTHPHSLTEYIRRLQCAFNSPGQNNCRIA